MSSFIILLLFDFEIDLYSVLTGVMPFVQIRSALSKRSKNYDRSTRDSDAESESFPDDMT